jgi:molecular chaperone Hsp33
LVAEEKRADVAGAVVEVRSALDREREIVLARGRFDALFAGYREQAAGQGPLPGEVGLEVMRQAQAAAGLQLALLPPDQFVAWTINLADPPLNVFLAGDNNDFQLTGRVYSRDVATAERNRLFVETQRPRHQPGRSLLDFDGRDMLSAFEQYHRRSVQSATRLFEVAGGDFMIVQGLPRVDRDWLAGLDAAAAAAIEQAAGETIETRRYRWRCGCNSHKMLSVMRSMFGEQPGELFGDQPEVEVRCPRCGRRWLVARQEFEAYDAQLGFS